MTIHTSTNSRFWAVKVVPGTFDNPVRANDRFIKIAPEQMQVETGKRADKICSMMQDVMEGRMTWRDYINHPFHKSDVELDILQDKCKPYTRVI